MKYGLLGLAALVLSTQAYAENYRIVQSPAQKLDVWIDDVKNNQLSSWCNSTINLRIVTMGEKNPTVLKEFLPRVAGLMATQCKPLQQLHWQLTDPEGSEIATGSAARAQQWKTVVTPAAPQQQQQQPTTAAVPVDALRNAAQADTSPWLQFSLLDGCHFRTWWQHPAQGSALFVPAKQGLVCGSDGWLSGQSRLTQQGNGASAAIGVTFLQGFPVTGLSNQSSTAELHITTVNSERMVLSNEKSPDSWLVLPFSNRFNGWQAVRQVVVQMPASEAADESAVQARLQEVRKVWSPWVSGDGTLSVQLVEKLHPELKNPAAAVYRTLN
ncbi:MULTISPECIES: hypothetical protein [Pantoea]|uniref:hypothetical protein n=1 Tax=Pantoea TaxID=53335 RepID=UPI0001E0ABBC|nr:MULTISPECIES: hypothetical protein [Pantoea]PQL28350.1 hypothetical protein C5L22_06810 [Pantoea ananatis]QXG53278.1 hypothetical protein KTJ90_11550 [Pantoea jilinensis]TPD96379.1 hypothetical protein FJP68_06525 [Pantoea vagans]EFM19831.1 conserved hypothetical protein [Pantoea sp. aB]ELP24045.1 hypothetical protein F385_2949 [Pantoea agglomerans 299R]